MSRFFYGSLCTFLFALMQLTKLATHQDSMHKVTFCIKL